VTDNFAAGYGGGVTASNLTATKSTISGNVASAFDGGGIYAGSATLTGTTITGNFAGRDGGGIDIYTQDGSAGLAFLTGCTLSNNSAGRNGGGFNGFDTATFINSTISGNFAGGAAISGPESEPSPLGGGGILASTANLFACTVSGNGTVLDGGGIWATTANLTNSTISGNTAGGTGGGMFIDTMQLLSDTIAENIANSGGGVSVNANGPASLKNTIIALNLVTFGGTGPDVDGNFNSQGHNLIGIVDSNATGFGAIGDQTGTASNPLLPGLSALGNHGGPTKTYALLAGSRAIDAGANDPLATLGASISASQTTFNVSTTAPFEPGMLIRIGSEVVRVISVGGGVKTLTVQRGVDGTTAAPHDNSTSSLPLLLGGDQRGVLRPRDGDGNGTAEVDIGSFEL
jgi:hypothetical protein